MLITCNAAPPEEPTVVWGGRALLHCASVLSRATDWGEKGKIVGGHEATACSQVAMVIPPGLVLDAFERVMESLRAREIPFECVLKIKEFFWLGPVLPLSC